MGATVDFGGAPTATRMLGGFILVAFFLCLLLAWPGRQRWPIWLICALCLSLSGALAMSLIAATEWWFTALRVAVVAIAAGLVSLAAVNELRQPLS